MFELFFIIFFSVFLFFFFTRAVLPSGFRTKLTKCTIPEEMDMQCHFAIDRAYFSVRLNVCLLEALNPHSMTW